MARRTPFEWARSQPLPKLIAWIVGVGVVIGVIIPILLVASQRLSVLKTRTTYPAPGRLVDVSGHQMHIDCQGESEDGGPTVVIDADAANFSLDWVGIQRDLEGTLRVCLYDRAGYGWSEPVAAARTADEIATELHALLQASGEAGPYVLVGHGLGGVHAQLYAAKYPDELAGLVLVDPWTEVFLSPTYSGMWRRRLDGYEQMRFLTSSGLLGIVRPFARRMTTPAWVAMLPQDVRSAYLALVLDRAYYDTAIDEVKHLGVSLDQVDTAFHGDAPLGGLPLIVLTSSHTADPDARPGALDGVVTPQEIIVAHREIAGLSMRGERRSLGQSWPWIQIYAPGAVEAAVEDVTAIARVFGGNP